jgi:hypothetical protein
MPITLMITGLAQAQMFTPYSEFQAMTLNQLNTLQVKLTFVGAQEGPIPTVAFTSPANVLDLSKFVPFRRPDISYANDEIAVKSFTASTTELKAVIDDAGMIPAVVAGGEAADTYVSFALCNTVATSVKVFEVVLSHDDTVVLFQALRKALATNAEGLRIVNEMGCFIAAREPGVPTDVSAIAPVSLSGVRLDRATGRFVTTASVKNTSASVITGPVSLVLIFPGTVKLFNASGLTCGTSPVGRDFIDFPLVGNVLPADGTAQVKLEFTNPDSEPISPTTKVLAGPGSR